MTAPAGREPPDHEEGRPQGTGLHDADETSGLRVDQVGDYLFHVRRRVLVDALQEATRDYWLRRAAQFAKVGNASCDQVAENCRIHARLMADHVVDVAELLEEVA